jgi:hypothetical protein
MSGEEVIGSIIGSEEFRSRHPLLSPAASLAAAAPK